jgi:hypothetical protein
MVDENWNAMRRPAAAGARDAALQERKAAGLGVPLPAGRVRMFDGKDFLGEAQLGHTPANQDVALDIGKSSTSRPSARARTSSSTATAAR